MNKHRWSWEVFFIVCVLGLIVVVASIGPSVFTGTVLVAGTVGAHKRKPKEQDVSEEGQLNEALNELVDGHTKYLVPRIWMINGRRRVEVQVARILAPQQKEELAKLPPLIAVENSKVGQSMSIKVTGAAFVIQNLSEEQQVILPEGWTRWQWDVTPQQTGEHPLTFSMSIRLIVGREQGNHSLPARTFMLKVDENNLELVNRVGRQGLSFLAAHWKEIGAAIAVVTAAPFLLRLFGK